jgi:hypothetical protein
MVRQRERRRPWPHQNPAPGTQPKQLNAGSFQPGISSFRLHLAAEGKAAKTVWTYTEAVQWFAGQAGRQRSPDIEQTAARSFLKRGTVELFNVALHRESTRPICGRPAPAAKRSNDQFRMR